ncbi:hypothetical protein HF086_003335 [Spodoptera exigua]|uniref:Uncharacterized protein n=1 Tax=Spodoptera exigua TaxID=7107 RepID=A0A922SP91_SPOEX|nr:hypothetical protein HF086_003335 [Spodoptera exigua]
MAGRITVIWEKLMIIGSVGGFSVVFETAANYLLGFTIPLKSSEANAGFAREKYNYPELPDICSYRNNVPIVCCTDCKIPDTERYRHTAIGPLATLVDTTGPVAWSSK